MALRKALLVLLLGALLTPWSAAFANKYDVLELPATPSEKAIHSSMFFVGKFGNRYFAAGQMGHILYSDDNGTSWTQAQVPVRSTILDVYFVNDQLGWAVGHEGLILHSSDGGKSWQELPGLREHGSGSAWQPGAGGMCLHTILPDPADPRRMIVAISTGGAAPSSPAPRSGASSPSNSAPASVMVQRP